MIFQNAQYIFLYTIYLILFSLLNILQLVKKPSEFSWDVGELPANHLTQL